jgi:hypothetical protein
MKKRFLSRVLAVALTALAGFPSSGSAAEQFSRLWSIAVHLEYVDGTSYDVVFARNVETQDVSSVLAECGRSHQGGAGAVVHYHCYPIPD